MPASLSFPPVADTYVSSSSPTKNYGNATTFRLDASPDLHSYLRFQVQGTMGVPITRATLRIYTNTTSAIGVQTLGVSNTTWGETSTNYNNAPALGSVLASSGAVTSNTWVSLKYHPLYYWGWNLQPWRANNIDVSNELPIKGSDGQ